MEYALETNALTKRYGDRRGIEDVTLAVEPGEMFGFIGPNGAGKSTTIRTLLGLLRPTSGTARLLGRDVVRDGPAARLPVGYVPGETAFYDDLKVRALLEYLGRFQPGDHAKRRAELVEALGIELDARANDLSLGNRKKVAIAAALQHRPRLVILDEPTNGLDPVMQVRLFELLRDETARGTTVFFSSHVLSEVQRMCRRVAVLSEGRLVAVEDVAALRGRQVRRVRAQLPSGLARSELAALEGTSSFDVAGETASFLYAGPMDRLLHALAAVRPFDVHIEEPSLEEIFLSHYLGQPRQPEVTDVAVQR